jgi:hypothetical protein
MISVKTILVRLAIFVLAGAMQVAIYYLLVAFGLKQGSFLLISISMYLGFVCWGVAFWYVPRIGSTEIRKS